MKMLVIALVLLSTPALAYKLTDEERAILAEIVLDPDAWANHAEASGLVDASGLVAAIQAKVEKYRAPYDKAKAAKGRDYKSRSERCAAKEPGAC